VNPAEVDLAAVVRQALELSEARREKANVACRAIGPESLPVKADGRLLTQAVLNLALNAIEAMESGGELRIEYSPPPIGSQARQFELAVQDSGPGVPGEIAERVFNPFFTTKETGTGLGLAIVHRIVEAHDGTIRLCQPPEGGARFEIRV
jgi:signal transduction histidine kinase